MHRPRLGGLIVLLFFKARRFGQSICDYRVRAMLAEGARKYLATYARFATEKGISIVVKHWPTTTNMVSLRLACLFVVERYV